MPEKILIIEDNKNDANMVKELLESEGFKVDAANTGEEGLKKALEMKPDLVVLDLMLPDTDGFKVCEKLKKEQALKNTMVVVLTIKDSIDDITKAFRVGADDYVIKPAVTEFLVRKVKLYLGAR